MTSLNQIDTVVVVMMENRSFDHLLGYLSLPAPLGGGRTDVEGLKPDMKNTFKGIDYPVFHLPSGQVKLPGDPSHEREFITMQLLNAETANGAISTAPPYPMSGFVTSLSKSPDTTVGQQPFVMGYHNATDLPAADFFAKQFCICDHWFSPIPTGTQPNRLMAMSGYTLNDKNQKTIIPRQKLVYDWLSDVNVRWRVYHQGIPFFMLMDDWHLKVLTDNRFREFDDLQDDIMTDSDEEFPQVIFIEPRYADAPHIEAPTDDHPPTPIINGQHFLLKLYSFLTANPDRWSRTVVFVTYDENGGFFDHVSPLPIITEAPVGSDYPAFLSTGPRVPGFIISPFVQAGSVYHTELDHTSILKFIAAKFNGGSYSPDVDPRPVDDLTQALTLDVPREDIPMPEGIGQTPQSPPKDPTPLAFKDAVTDATATNPVAAMKKFPELFTHFEDY